MLELTKGKFVFIEVVSVFMLPKFLFSVIQHFRLLPRGGRRLQTMAGNRVSAEHHFCVVCSNQKQKVCQSKADLLSSPEYLHCFHERIDTNRDKTEEGV